MATCSSCGTENPEGSGFCNGCGSKLDVPAPREVRKTVTALFCDLVGSTSLGETYDPEVLRPLLDRYFTEMRTAIERHGGRVEKYIGDAVAAIFGLPVAHEDDALRAVRAGVEMQERMQALNEGSTIRLAARVGIMTGEVLVPADGTPIIGDAMNSASRLQSGAAPGDVWVGEPTWRLVRDAVVAEPLEPIDAKGKAEPVAALRVIQVASLSPMRTRYLDGPMVGRERESALLDRALERVATDRACQLFTVLGTAGAGKSRLVEEFLGTLDDAEVLQGRCLPYGEGITYYPVTEALKEALGLADFDDVARVRDAIAEAVASEEHAEALCTNLATLLGAGEGGSPEETFWAIRRFFETRGRERPLVVVFDDVQWGEETFLDLITHIAEWSRDAQILVLCMARPDLLDVRSTWGGGLTNATTISLAPLSDAECDELIDHLLGYSAVPEDVRLRITRVAEGNPLFVEEMLRMLVDDDLLVRDGDRWIAAGDLSGVQVPPTISALLSARLDRLSPSERTTIERAAVIGRDFHRGAVRDLLPHEARDGLDVDLRSLVRKELIAPERSALPGEDAYRFRHLLIRDAAYDTVPKSERAELHERFADWLEGVAGERVVEQEEIVGSHLERAYRYREELGMPGDVELRVRAARALGRAGVRALARGDGTAAIGLLSLADDLSIGDSLQMWVLNQLELAFFSMAEFDQQRRVADRQLELAVAAGDVVYEVAAMVSLHFEALIRDPRGWDAAQERELMERSLRIYRDHGAADLVPHGLVDVAGAEWFSGRAAASLMYGSDALQAALERGDRVCALVAFSYVTTALEEGPAPMSSVLRRADGFVGSFAVEPSLLADALLGRASANASVGRSDEARADLARSRAISEELGDPWASPDLTLVEGRIVWLERGSADAEPIFAQAHAQQLDSGRGLGLGDTGAVLTRVLLDLDRDTEADAVLRDFRDQRIPTSSIEGQSQSALIAARRGEHDEALRVSDAALSQVGATDLLRLQGEVALDRAQVLLLAGRPDEARASAEGALARFERKEHALGIQRARAFLQQLEKSAT